MIFRYYGIEFNRVYIEADTLELAMAEVHEYFKQDIEKCGCNTPFSSYLYCIDRESWAEYSTSLQESEMDEFMEALTEWLEDWYNPKHWDSAAMFTDIHF